MRLLRLLALAALALPLFAAHHSAYVFASRGEFTVANGDDIESSTLKRLYGDDFFWFRRDGRAYLVRDAATLATLRDLYRPQSDLGREQAALGEKQSALGRQQATIGEEQARLGVQQARIGLSQAGDDDSGKRARQNELSRRQNELGQKQNDLGRQQNVLGEQQQRLGARQQDLSRDIEKKVDGMLGDLIRRGVAKEVSR